MKIVERPYKKSKYRKRTISRLPQLNKANQLYRRLVGGIRPALQNIIPVLHGQEID